MKSIRFSLAAAFCLLHATLAQAALDPAEWLYYSMYPGDYSHAVHLSAISQRPDGLLESASRYPRHRDETWTEAESARGWYNYVPRLIDCETGLSIETGEALLDADGKSVAKRDQAGRLLADWKKNLDDKLQNHKWPVRNELFLACAGARDEKLQATRRKLAKMPPPRLAYKPIIASLREDSDALFERTLWLDRVELGKKGGGTSSAKLFDAAAWGYGAWLARFMPQPAPVPVVAQAGLSESRQAWLKERGIDVEAVQALGDGTLDYVNRNPTRFDVPYGVLEQRPAVTDNATNAAMRQRLDCRNGLQLGLQVDWQDDSRALLARQTLPAAVMAPELDQQIVRFGQESADILSPPRLGDEALRICVAAAAQCTDSKPRIPDAFALKASDWKAIDQAATAAEALLAVRKAYRAYRQSYVPNCRFGAAN